MQKHDSASRPSRLLIIYAASLALLIAARLARASTDSTSGIEVAKAAHLLDLPQPLAFSDKGHLEVDDKKWKVETDTEGTEILTSRGSDEARAAAMKTDDGHLEVFAAYALTGARATKSETSGVLFFANDHVRAFTSCRDSAVAAKAAKKTEDKKNKIGRICVTATAALCSGLRSGKGVDDPTIKELETYETKALASILTLRGADHQLENLADSGNRLGLKTGLQTTRGQLLALAKQVARETGPDAKKPLSPNEAAESLAAKTVLEASLPRLKRSCQEAGF